MLKTSQDVPEGRSVPNERLRSALASRGLTPEAVAAHARVNPKTVERWLGGRTPYATHRWAVASLLREDETYLWPEVVTATRASDATHAELVGVHARRSDVPVSLWSELLRRAEHQVDLLTYAALFLHENQSAWVDLLRSKADAGVQVRIALGHPSGARVQERGAEEQFGDGISSRVRMALRHYEPLHGHERVELRLHDTTLYNSIFRFDEDMLVNTHVWGANAYGAPLIHLRRVDGGGLFDTYSDSFELVWAQATPATPELRKVG
jgi:transcriptional regulator with XRE-family HTH domain